MVKVIFATLQESGFVDRLSELKQMLVSKDVQGAAGIVEAIDSWTRTIQTFAATEACEILRVDQERAATSDQAAEGKTWLM